MTSQPTSNAKLRIVPDTGFYIASALKNGYARSYLIGRGSKFLTYELFSSEPILLETQEKLEDTFAFERAQVVKTIKEIRRIVTVVHPTQKVTIVRDPDDNKILECALEAQADMIVAFDKDLLALKEYEGIKVIHPTVLQYMFRDTNR
jgi:putative PIN family toxin of toxin-antitoxin system